jgi:hypothetical protein
MEGLLTSLDIPVEVRQKLFLSTILKIVEVHFIVVVAIFVFDLKIRNALGTNTFPESVRTPMQR